MIRQAEALPQFVALCECASRKAAQADLLRQLEVLPCSEQAASALRWFGVCEDDWGSKKPVEAAREFAGSY